MIRLDQFIGLMLALALIAGLTGWTIRVHVANDRYYRAMAGFYQERETWYRLQAEGALKEASTNGGPP